jgi:hypothetical protein
MSHLPDDDDRLTPLLRAIATPEPPPDFLAGARRRYAQALEARYRREVLTSLVASALGLGVAATLLLSVFDPVGLIAWGVVTAAELAAWTKGVVVVLSIVPPVLWAPALLGAVVSLLPFVLLARARAPLVAK